MIKNTILFLDDEPARIPMLPRQYDLHYVRTPAEFVAWLKENGTPEIISFDHDLAGGSYDIGYTSLAPETGADCARWAIENGFLPQRVIIHSWNSYGAQKIANLFAEAQHEDVFVKEFNPKRPHLWKE